MKKNIFLLGVFLISSIQLCLKAQSYTLNSSNIFTMNIGLNDTRYDGIEFTNISSQTLMLRWKKIDIDTVAGSYFDMCASGECYFGVPDSGIYNNFPTLPGDVGFLKMHFWAGNTAGISKARVYLYDTLAPNNGDTLVFIMNITQATTIAENNQLELFKIYPNPVNQYFFVETNNSFSKENFEVSVFNSLGKIVFKSKLSSPEVNRFDLGNFANGVYYAQIISEDKKTIQTKKIIIKH